MTDVPASIRKAAAEVEDYFAARGVLAWKLGDIQSRTQPVPSGPVVDITPDELHLATSYRPEIVGLAYGTVWLRAGLMQLALMCLSGRTARVKLPSGRTLRITLEP